MESPRPKIIAECWVTSPEYRIMRDNCHAQGLPITFVNGCFDLFHSGHVRLLHHTAREVLRLSCWHNRGPLVVGLNTDYSVRELKGPGRPVLNWAERAIVLAAIDVVDAVVGFDEADASALIGNLKPRFYGKGGDYAGKDIPELKALPDGAAAIYAPRSEINLIDMSSSKVLAKVIDAEATRVSTIPGSWSPLKAAIDSLARARDQADGPGGGGKPGG